MAHRLLVADSSLTIQKVIRLALSNEGYEIQAVSDGREALEQIALFRPDIVLVDASLPKKSAFELKAECGKPGVKFVLMASAFDPVDEDKVKGAGFDGRLVKPFDPAHLRQVLADVARIVRKSTDIFSAALAPEAPVQPKKAPDADPLWESSTEPDFEWAVDERHAKGSDGSKFGEPGEIGEKTLTDLWASEPAIEPPSKTFLDSDFPVTESTGVVSTPAYAAPAYAAPTPAAPIAPPPLSEAKLEELIAKQFQKTFESLAREKIPEIAERVIRQEIGRLLANPPAQP